jgi:3-deoxy-D-manno-octulosonate 8-phosphate phosphatase (KDO 8-P phosphatase)
MKAADSKMQNPIKLFIFDVDGTLTDGTIIYGGDGVELKAFNAKDGLALGALSKLGCDVIFFTGRSSEAVARRAAELDVKCVQGVVGKCGALQELLTERNIGAQNAAYIGDDLNDLSAMRLCGFKGCPSDAADEIKSICDYVSPKRGGCGAVRDILEYLLKEQGKWDMVLEIYGAS